MDDENFARRAAYTKKLVGSLDLILEQLVLMGPKEDRLSGPL